MAEVLTPNPVPTKSEYESLLSYFKYLVTLATGFIGLLVTGAGLLFYSNVKAIREDAREEATRVATSEAKARVTEAFDQKNINALILSAAQEKVGTVADRIINQQLTSKLGPLQQRIALVGQISESEMRMRMGFRDGLNELTRLLKSTGDPDVLRFGKASLATTSQDFETRVQENSERLGIRGLQMLQNYLFSQHRPQESVPSDLRGVVKLIHSEPDLSAVAAAFVAFRDFTDEKVRMFDFDAVASWCSRNQGRCQNQ